MPIEWTTERVLRWTDDGERDERDARCAQRWRLRVISDREANRVGGAPVVDFSAVLDGDLELWVRSWSTPGEPYERSTSGDGADLEVVGDVTRGMVHDTTVRAKPSDETVARWYCSCGVGSRGGSSPERAEEAAELHRTTALDRVPGPTDVAVAQGPDGRWGQREIRVARRFRVCARSDFSVVKVHRTGHGEEFELVVDGQLGLWVRRLGVDTALRKDESARGVSLLVLESA